MKKMATVNGGKGHMLGKQNAGTQTPGQTAHKPKSSGGKFASGGSTPMFGKQCSSPAKAR